VQPVHVLVGVKINQEVRPIYQLNLEPLPQQVNKEIVRFREAWPDVAKIKVHFHGIMRAGNKSASPRKSKFYRRHLTPCRSAVARGNVETTGCGERFSRKPI
jgi:hypothetical protein